MMKDPLNSLPQYDPPEEVWENVRSVLEGDSALRASLKHLPQYEPPGKIWGGIKKELENKKRFLIYRLAAAAAILLIPLGAWWFLNKPVSSERITISFSQEVVQKRPVLSNEEADREITQMVDGWCEQYDWICTTDEFIYLKNELEDLSQARVRLLKAIGPYDDNPVLITTLSRIERERSEVLRRMASLM